MVIVLPLGLLPASVISDVIYFITGRGFWGEMGFWLAAGGILGGLLAAVFGTIDWLAIPPHTRAKRIGTMHALLNVVVIGVFVVSWSIRRGDVSHPPAIATILGALALVIAAVSAWFGGELIYRLSIGVDPGANPDASSSLRSE
ncbi:MAG: rane protein-like protein [Chthoniobacter sp.]|jgi:uncharacterized membrane protein|nr:rane protein-like protein [Chthoniobacter sp.]